MSVTEDRTMLFLNESAGLAGGIEIEGERAWTGDLGRWEMTMQNVKVRPRDPVPYDGRYELVTPRDLLASVEFSRVDDDTIEMVFTGPRNTRIYQITSSGVVSEVSGD